MVLLGEPVPELLCFIDEYNPSCLVTDFDPLRIKREWKQEIVKQISIPLFEVDAHNIVPCQFVSQKEEYGAYTLRPKINRILSQFLTDFPIPETQVNNPYAAHFTDWDRIFTDLNADASVSIVHNFRPGAGEAKKRLHEFLEQKLDFYIANRNDPNGNALSDLSPYLHFGQISAQRIAYNLLKAHAENENATAYLEELIVRRELADNFCFYNPHYDSVSGFKEWALSSLRKHQTDEREYIYSRETLEAATTHDALWNAAQTEMMKTGKMHGYMRMYWAKKILEWTPSPEIALQTAIYLNDKYLLDGRDPNGYAGCAWSIGGIHDRAWGERPVFGKIRYMNLNGCKRKFDVDSYISRINQIQYP
jgi:deoxyribodipyrimidine photo-lyase